MPAFDSVWEGNLTLSHQPGPQDQHMKEAQTICKLINKSNARILCATRTKIIVNQRDDEFFFGPQWISRDSRQRQTAFLWFRIYFHQNELLAIIWQTTTSLLRFIPHLFNPKAYEWMNEWIRDFLCERMSISCSIPTCRASNGGRMYHALSRRYQFLRPTMETISLDFFFFQPDDGYN